MDNYILNEQLDKLVTAANNNDEYAQSLLALCYIQGKMVKKDYDEAFKWCCLAIDGYNSLKFYLKENYKNEEKVKRNLKKLFSSFLTAAVKGEVSAQYAVGCFYCYGWGVERDSLLAKEWFIKAAQKKHKDAIRAMYELY